MVRWIALALSLLVLGAATASAQGRYHGVVTGPQYENCEAAKQLGVKMVRVDIEWYTWQPSEYSAPDWSSLKDRLDCFRNADIDIFGSLDYAPDWAGGGSNHIGLPDITDWQNFVEDAMSELYGEYGSHITFGIWNEPNLSNFLTGCTYPYNNKGVCYAHTLFIPAANARDNVNTSIRMAGPETAGYNGAFEDAFDIIESYLRSQDIITLHSYESNAGDITGVVSDAVDYASGRETWLTEAGSEEGDHDQALWIDGALNAFETSGESSWTKTFIYFLAYDNNPSDPWFSIFRGTEKRPSYYWFQQHLGLMGTPYSVSFQADNGNYVVAESNGDDVINADRTSIGSWETLWLYDLNGGSLESGDSVAIMTNNESYWFNAPLWSDGQMHAWPDTTYPPTVESIFEIIQLGSGTIGNGDSIALRAGSSRYYLCAEYGGGDTVTASRTSIGPWETFELIVH